MCTLGMAGEYRDDGVAFNALWPRTGIWTAALKMLGGGMDEAAKGCRTEEIMSDAAHLMLTQDAKSYSGNFEIDEDVLRNLGGVTNFDKYECYPGEPLMPDFFIDNYEERYGSVTGNDRLGNDETAKASNTSSGSPMDDIMSKMNSTLLTDGPRFVEKIQCIYQFTIKDTKETYFLDLKSGAGQAGKLSSSDNFESDVQFTMKEKVFIKMFKGQINSTTAFMTGKLKIKGDMKKAMALERLMSKMNGSS